MMSFTLRLGAIIGCVAAVSVIASFVFLWLTDLYGLVSQPWLAWWNHLLFYRPMSLFIASSLIESAMSVIAPLAIIGKLIHCYRVGPTVYQQTTPGKSLYGNSKFASTGDMKAGGIRKSKSPFG